MEIFHKIKKMRILLIEGDEWIRDSLMIFFEAKGCPLEAFETAEEGIAAVRKRSYDLLIVDYMLPGMDGIEFFKRIAISHPGVLKILLSAYANREISSLALKAGVRDIIEKPFNMFKIKGSLTRLIENNYLRQEASYDNRPGKMV